MFLNDKRSTLSNDTESLSVGWRTLCIFQCWTFHVICRKQHKECVNCNKIQKIHSNSSLHTLELWSLLRQVSQVQRGSWGEKKTERKKQMYPRCLHLNLAHVQMASCSLVRFLWCMLWCRTNSSLRANFFWQFGHRQLNGFSPERQRWDGWTDRC